MKKDIKKSVSAVIPFKGIKNLPYLKACVNSLKNQTVDLLEIIIVGEKEALTRLKDVKKVYARVDKNEARNIGASKARGRYILFLDHDMLADQKLVENCLNLSDKFDAIILPEKGLGGNFWENCKKLEKELIVYDIHTVTPRFYRRNLFPKKEKPFDNRFGLLDEWGFNHKLVQKKALVGYSSSFVSVNEGDLTLVKEIMNKFKRGMWMRNFYEIDKKEAWTRINPIQRGVLFYIKRLHFFIKEPIYFPGLIFLKTIDFLAFMAGYLISFFVKSKQVKIK